MKFTVTIDILQTPEELFSWLAEPQKAKLWQKGVKDETIIKETKEKIGTTFKEVIEENGKSLEMTGVITDYKQDKLIAFHLKSKIHSVDVIYSILRDESKSILTVESKIIWKFPMNVISLIIGKKIRNGIIKQTEFELKELKKQVETKEK